VITGIAFSEALNNWLMRSQNASLASAVDGFNIVPDVEPSGAEAFVKQVVPIRLADDGSARCGMRAE
jgi:hypothetical protein